jgi:putative heme iron utilization protein
MTKTNTERQAAYRKNAHLRNEYRLNTYISGEAKTALEAVARHYAVTKVEILERLLLAEKDAILAGIYAEYPEAAAQDREIAKFFGQHEQ